MNDIDNALLDKAKNGNIKAFETISIHYEKLIYSIAYRMFRNPEDAKDIAQETLIKIYKNMDKCQNVVVLKAWICRITTNTCIDEMRKRKGKYTESIDKEMNFEDGEYTREIQSDSLTPEDMLIKKELKVDIDRAIKKLSPEYRILIILRDIQGLSYLELAEATASNLGTVKSRLSRARENLKKLILLEQKKL